MKILNLHVRAGGYDLAQFRSYARTANVQTRIVLEDT